MDIRRLIGIGFTVFFVIILFYIIIRSLILMSKDMGQVSDEDERVLKLKVISSGSNKRLKKGTVITIREEVTFGRNGDNSLVLEDPYVSAYHFKIFPKDDRFVIEDLESTNGTLLNDERLTMKTYLRKEDTIRVGNLSLKVLSL